MLSSKFILLILTLSSIVLVAFAGAYLIDAYPLTLVPAVQHHSVCVVMGVNNPTSRPINCDRTVYETHLPTIRIMLTTAAVVVLAGALVLDLKCATQHRRLSQ